jgi:hypothetical protein
VAISWQVSFPATVSVHDTPPVSVRSHAEEERSQGAKEQSEGDGEGDGTDWMVEFFGQPRRGQRHGEKVDRIADPSLGKRTKRKVGKGAHQPAGEEHCPLESAQTRHQFERAGNTLPLQS